LSSPTPGQNRPPSMISVTTSRLANVIAHGTVVLSRLADRIGVEPGQLLDAAALARLPLPSLITVAQMVDYPIQELFARSNNKPPYDDDAAAVDACLGDRPQALTRDTLARALDWDLDRVETAVRHLDIRLAVAGLRLRAEGATIRIEESPGLLNSTLGRYSTAAPETVRSTGTSAKRYRSQHSAKTFETHPKKDWSKPSDGTWSKPEADGHTDQNPSSSASCSPTAVTDTGPAFPLTRPLRSTDKTPAFPLTKSAALHNRGGHYYPPGARALDFT
jgi:hypothetical protein